LHDTLPEPVEETIEAARRWADQLCGDIVLVPFKDGAPDWSMTRADLDFPDLDIDPTDLPRLAILTESFDGITLDVPFGSGVSVVSWWDGHGAEQVQAINGVPEYTDICEGIVRRSIETGWPVQRRKLAAPPINDLPVIDIATWEGKEVADREWFIDGLIPARNVTLLSGDGGLGKSLLALQIGVASALDRVTLGLKPQAGRVLYVAAEDEAEEFQRRAADILRAHGATFADTGGRFHLVPLADHDALLASPGRSGVMEPTKLFGEICGLIDDHCPDLVVLDTAADMFGGDEIKRAQVRQFIAMLRRVCLSMDCAILLLAHPSVAGMQTGTGSSGSTAWNNSVRSRLYLTAASGDGADPDGRVLSTMKSNYGKKGGSLAMRWADGVFVVDDGTTPNPSAGLLNRKADEVFLDLLSMFNRLGQPCSPSPSVTYGPKRMDGHPDSAGIKKKAFEQAMHRLLKSGAIKIVHDGPPSKRRARLWVAAEDFGPDLETTE
jgi:KaiC/GvpD/RAD55 family RecA-like ATPase